MAESMRRSEPADVTQGYYIGPVEIPMELLFPRAVDITDGPPYETATVHAPREEVTAAASLTTAAAPGLAGAQEARKSRQRKHVSISSAGTTAPLLEDLEVTPKGWPTAPKVIRPSWWVIVCESTFDLLLLSCGVAFLAFAATVSHYDQASTLENPRTTRLLLSATKYVSVKSQYKISTLTFTRDQQFSLSSSR